MNTESVKTEEQRREIFIPLGTDQFASIPFPMDEESFQLLLSTLELWKPRLVRPAISVIPSPIVFNRSDIVRARERLEQ